MKRKSTEQRLGLEKPQSVPLHALLVHSVAVQGCLPHGIHNLRLLNFPVHLLELTHSLPSINLVVSVFQPGHWTAACSNTPFAAAFQSDESGEIPKIMV